MTLDNFVPDLSKPSSVGMLASALGISTPIFELIIAETNPERLYRRHLIPKRSHRNWPRSEIDDTSGIRILSLPRLDESNCRTVWEPHHAVVRLGHKSAARVLDRYFSRPGSGYPHPCSFGYTRKRSTLQNAMRHVGAARIVGADIKDFFPTITIGRIEVALEQAGISRDLTLPLAKFLTISGTLPLGLNASPTIANLVCMALDAEFLDLAMRHNARYTRYADDITFSSRDRSAKLPDEEDIEQVLEKHGFRANRSKFRKSKRGQKHYVTGLSISEPDWPHAPKTLKRRLRQELYYIRKYGWPNHYEHLSSSATEQSEINRIDGTVNYVASIEAKGGAELRRAWKEISLANDIERSFSPRPLVSLRRSRWYVDESELVDRHGQRLLAVCAVDILEVEAFELAVARLIAEELGDAFSIERSVTYLSKGLHWSELSWRLREKVIAILSVTPLRSIIAMSALDGSLSYVDVYTRLLARVCNAKMRSSDDATVDVFVERNSSKVSEQVAIESIASVYRSLVDKNERRPVSQPTVKVFSKGEVLALAVPDILLGVLGSYASSRSGPTNEAVKVQFFEKLRSKYAVIFHDEEGMVYHSKRPFIRW